MSFEYNFSLIEEVNKLTESTDERYKGDMDYNTFMFQNSDITLVLLLMTVPGIGKVGASRYAYKLKRSNISPLSFLRGVINREEDTKRLCDIIMTSKDVNNIYDTIKKPAFWVPENILIILSIYLNLSIDDIKAGFKKNRAIKSLCEFQIYYLINIFPEYFKEIDILKKDLSIDYSETDRERINTAIYSVLKTNEVRYKNMYEKKDRLISNVCDLTEVDKKTIQSILEDEISLGNIIEENYGEKVLYLYENYNISKGSAKNLKERLKKPVSLYDIDTIIKEEEKNLNIKLTDKQLEAVTTAINSNVSIITGGPGTGKTTIINMILRVLKKLKKNSTFTLLAPTGKAARRMEEVTGFTAYTIHRRLGISKDNENERLRLIETDIVISDEMSMVDSELFYRLITNVSSTSKIVFVGDYNQLPSVGPGLVLKDLIESKKLNLVRLDKRKRQSEDSDIVKAAEKVNKGEPLMGTTYTKTYREIDEQDEKRVMSAIESTIRALMLDGYKIDDILILSPRKEGYLGEININKTVQNLLNKRKTDPIKVKNDEVIYKGDKVIVLKNNYRLNVMNGEIGTYMGFKDKKPIFKFRGRLIEFVPEDLEEVGLSYAITVHKSQGDETKVVLFIINNKDEIVTNKNILYTGMTRAKERLYIIGDFNYLNRKILKIPETRLTGLKEELFAI